MKTVNFAACCHVSSRGRTGPYHSSLARFSPVQTQQQADDTWGLNEGEKTWMVIADQYLWSKSNTILGRCCAAYFLPESVYLLSTDMGGGTSKPKNPILAQTRKQEGNFCT